MQNSILPDGMHELKKSVVLPDVLDMLIVGGGPAGTAAAFRAKELGLSALVVDFDDILKRIRDYAKNKPILPSFGGGDSMQFPKGGDLIRRLHFGPIDKDEMCVQWKKFYYEESIPVQIGVELTGLEKGSDGTWTVKTWNHRLKQEQIISAQHVVVSIGRGVPRRFDIPGNLDGIGYRLDDAENYLGSPACVIGGGTSAAEAVIAISNAKIAAQDESSVYWSYRGDKMPRVSKALSEVFFDAYVGNGNIRYHPGSEPVAIVTAPDKNEYLSVRVDRRSLDGRPHETLHLEFKKTFCIACIGEDLPEALLQSMGISLFTGGPKAKKRVTVSPLLESQQENVYLIGDILSQVYLEADDFSADPATFREIKHRGIVKSALRDGVFVAEVIRQKLDGKTKIYVELEFEVGEMPEVTDAPAQVATVVESGGPPKESIPEERKEDEQAAVLVKMTPAGIDEDEFKLYYGKTLTIGKKDTDLVFINDDGLEDHHASIESRSDRIYLRDEGSTTGTFLQLVPGSSMQLSDGDLIRLGQQFVVFSISDEKVFFTHYDAHGKTVSKHELAADSTVVLGRQAPDITLDPDDLVLSRRHLSLTVRDSGLFAKDLKSLNHSYLRVTGERELGQDDVFRVGQQLFRLSLSAEQPRKTTTFILKPPVLDSLPDAIPAAVPDAIPETIPDSIPDSIAEPETSVEKPDVAAAAASVTFKALGQLEEIGTSQTICDLAESKGITLNAECHVGICGSDPIRIISGAEFLNSLGDEEADTLDDICDLEAGNDSGKCRLACMTRVSGPVVIEIVEQD
ncbi:MAG: FHA domain-containing protein [Bacteroidetes bacterium]|nr:FHA domain-containing protein [Bacteroidota bacterium]